MKRLSKDFDKKFWKLFDQEFPHARAPKRYFQWALASAFSIALIANFTLFKNKSYDFDDESVEDLLAFESELMMSDYSIGLLEDL